MTMRAKTVQLTGFDGKERGLPVVGLPSASSGPTWLKGKSLLTHQRVNGAAITGETGRLLDGSGIAEDLHCLFLSFMKTNRSFIYSLSLEFHLRCDPNNSL